MNKHVESLPKVDKFIIFRYYTVSNLWRIAAYTRHFFKKTTQIVSDFFAFQIFFKVRKFATFNERQWTKVWSRWGLRPRPPAGVSHLYLGPPTP